MPEYGCQPQPSRTTTELDALKVGMEAEKQSIELYGNGARLASDPGAKALFQKLARVEQGHYDLLEEEYDWLKKSGAYFTLHRFSLPG